MAENESTDPDDLLSRRMKSGSPSAPSFDAEPSEATAEFDALAPDSGSSGSGSSDRGNGAKGGRKGRPVISKASDPDSTASVPRTAGAKTPADPGPTSDASGTGKSAGKPDLFSEEEWALITGGPRSADDSATGDGSAAKGKAGKKAKRGKKGRGAAATAGAAAGATGTAAATAGGASAAGFRAVPATRRTVVDVIGIVWTTIAVPFMLLAVAIRAIASGWFLRFEYLWNPAFPADEYGFSAADRLHYGSYAVDYLHNQDGSRYLEDIVFPEGIPLFRAAEVSHMADVKSLVSLLFTIAIVGAIGCVVFGLIQSRRTGPGIRMGYRLGSVFTLVLFGALAVLAILGWDTFFTRFHEIFFADGTWQFYLDDSLIRLFPPQFWVDAGIGVGVMVLIGVVLTFVWSFAGHKKRAAARRAAAKA
ncbi:TIGR01906 family membrane protein [Brevibacterium litoralis]|uniref:TIGR01906 family membrane protein n=1 Tax=Brevibacterium litoralis TaxID=3138935 RepID=UPI0032EFFCB4